MVGTSPTNNRLSLRQLSLALSASAFSTSFLLPRIRRRQTTQQQQQQQQHTVAAMTPESRTVRRLRKLSRS